MSTNITPAAVAAAYFEPRGWKAWGLHALLATPALIALRAVDTSPIEHQTLMLSISGALIALQSGTLVGAKGIRASAPLTKQALGFVAITIIVAMMAIVSFSKVSARVGSGDLFADYTSVITHGLPDQAAVYFALHCAFILFLPAGHCLRLAWAASEDPGRKLRISFALLVLAISGTISTGYANHRMWAILSHDEETMRGINAMWRIIASVRDRNPGVDLDGAGYHLRRYSDESFYGRLPPELASEDTFREHLRQVRESAGVSATQPEKKVRLLGGTDAQD